MLTDMEQVNHCDAMGGKFSRERAAIDHLSLIEGSPDNLTQFGFCELSRPR
jgi:hypothetical protein